MNKFNQIIQSLHITITSSINRIFLPTINILTVVLKLFVNKRKIYYNFFKYMLKTCAKVMR